MEGDENMESSRGFMKMKESDVVLLDYRITRFHYDSEIILEDEEKIKYESYMKLGLTEPVHQEIKGEEVTLLRLDIELRIRGKVKRKNVVKIDLSISGMMGTQKLTEEEFKKIAPGVGVSNLLAIARSAVISLTSQTGNPPVLLPILNIRESIKKAAVEDQRDVS